MEWECGRRKKRQKKKKKEEERGLERSVGLNIYSRAVDANRNKHNEKKKKKVGSEVGEMERGLGEGAWLNERSG